MPSPRPSSAPTPRHASALTPPSTPTSSPGPSSVPGTLWPRRAWLTHNALALGLATPALRAWRGGRPTAQTAVRVAAQAQLTDPAVLEALAQRAVEAATAAGASYADARVTRTVQHDYAFYARLGIGETNALDQDLELLGLGVRALVNGYWGFSASPLWAPEEAVRLAQDAVAQAKINARGAPNTVELGEVPVAKGRWTTPIKIDPFSITIEEKADAIAYWMDYAKEINAWGGTGTLQVDPQNSRLHFARQEQTLATSAGTLVSQTLYESGGVMMVNHVAAMEPVVWLTGLNFAGKGWEMILEADILAQIAQAPAQIEELKKLRGKMATIGKYTLVCDGMTMAHLVEQTFGVATQLDRALGYEANAGGTSFLDDPLGMLGTAQVAAPMVTITANRSAPAQLATVKWDAEGVEPQDVTLVKDGVLADYQTTREQAAWLAPYYQKVGKPVRSHGYAAAEDALYVTMQHMPNLALEPARSAVGLDDLISNVTDGILVTNYGFSSIRFGIQTDHQARNGLFQGFMQQIKNGRLGPALGGEVGILFNTQDFWKRVVALGGPSTQAVYSSPGLYAMESLGVKGLRLNEAKGQPVQLTSHSVRAPAAIITEQALVNQTRRA